MSLVDIKVIVDGLNREAAALAPRLLPGGRRDGIHWRCGGIDGRAGNSFVLNISGPHPGQWREFSDGSAGDMLDLVAAAYCAGNKADALRWARRHLGLEDGDPRALERRRQVVERDQVQRAEKDEEARARKRRAAHALWLAGQESMLGTPADWYLRGRAIALACLKEQPGALRFHPAVRCVEAGRDLPAMLGLVVGADGHGIKAVHRTWLQPRADGSWGKAAIGTPKKVLGASAGGVIVITRGPSGKRLAEAPQGDAVLITEGIEDALTLALEPEGSAYRILTGIALGNLAKLDLPPTITEVTLALDRDGENESCRVARAAAVRHFQRQGRKVRIARPAEGFKDFNAMAVALMKHGVAA